LTDGEHDGATGIDSASAHWGGDDPAALTLRDRRVAKVFLQYLAAIVTDL
jgi:hypothetical protein